jgi:Na+-driven multidrug efflux pump
MPGTRLTYRQIFTFSLPLAGTWLMMAFEGPYLAAIIARLADPTENLAAFGVAFALAVIIEAPVIMLMAASTTLVADDASYRALRRFMLGLSLLLTLVQLVAVLPPVFNWVAGSLIGLPPAVAQLAHHGLIIMLPWPLAIGYRRFLQGLLIRHNLTRRVAYGTVLRLVTMSAVAFFGAQMPGLTGVHVGTLALSVGVVVEAVASRWMTREVVARITSGPPSPMPTTQTLAGVSSFYLPLALTSVMTMAIQPAVTFFMGQARYPLESLAVLPVIHGLTFLFRALGLSFQEVGIAMFGDRWEHYQPIRNFGYGLGAAAAFGLIVIAYTPLATVWFEQIAGLTPELAAFAVRPTQILAWLPACSVWMAFQRATLVHARHTRAITWASLVELAVVVVVLTATIVGLSWVGAVAAAAAILAGRVAGNVWLIVPARRASRSGQLPAASPVPAPG